MNEKIFIHLFLMPFKVTKNHRAIAMTLFIILLWMSYRSTGYIWGTNYTIMAWFIPIILNVNNWYYKKLNKR